MCSYEWRKALKPSVLGSFGKTKTETKKGGRIISVQWGKKPFGGEKKKLKKKRAILPDDLARGCP